MVTIAQSIGYGGIALMAIAFLICVAPFILQFFWPDKEPRQY